MRINLELQTLENASRTALSTLASKRRTKKTITKILLRLIDKFSNVLCIQDMDLPYGTTHIIYINCTKELSELVLKEYPQYYDKLQKLLILK